MFEYIFWYEVNQWFLNDNGPEILENYVLSENDKFPRRATGRLTPDCDVCGLWQSRTLMPGDVSERADRVRLYGHVELSI